MKKKVFFQALPEWGGRGVYPCPNFFALFQEVHFWSIKRVYFFKKANILNFELFLAVQDNSITDIVGRLVCPLEPTNNLSLGSIKEGP